mmetsp:Transcript_13686/g.19991  ORF Transcript_13686/g.19991 Transcript_13686/m.19991 type:complete len:523 (+) Transcript_13686:87-1655(+)
MGNTNKKVEENNSIRAGLIREQSNCSAHKSYDVVKVIGEGSMGTVSEVRRKQSTNKADSSYALKSIVLSRISKEFLDELRNEIDILKHLDHPNIVKAYETFESRRQIFVVMELCSGGDLYERAPYTEREAAKIVTKLLSAVAFMHANNVVHRDLKFENIMFESRKPDAEIKVIDFGLSKKFIPTSNKFSPYKEVMHEGFGTLYTMSPQVLQRVYTSQADLWSVGVITYMLLSSTKPFWGKNRRIVVDQIMKCKFYSEGMEGRRWEHVSQEAKNLVTSLIKLDPKERLTADEALKCTWLSDKFPLSDRRPDKKTMQDAKHSLISFADSGTFKKLALYVVAHNSTTPDIEKLRQVFDQYDSSNDGSITLAEFKAALEECNSYSEEEINQLFEHVDVNNDGTIKYTEFIAATIETQGQIEEDRLAEAFNLMDIDNSGYLTKDELRELLGSQYTKEVVKKFFAEADTDKNGKISYEEFLSVFQREKKKEVGDVISSLSMDTNDSGDLLDENAVIPGGIHDKVSNTS